MHLRHIYRHKKGPSLALNGIMSQKDRFELENRVYNALHCRLYYYKRLSKEKSNYIDRYCGKILKLKDKYMENVKKSKEMNQLSLKKIKMFS